MKTFVQEGRTFTAPAPYDRKGGEAALIGNIVAVAVFDVAQGAEGEWTCEGIYDLAKAPSQAWAEIGNVIYWDDENKRFTTVAAGNTLAGAMMATTGNGADETVGRVRLNGAARPAEAA